MCPRPLQLPRRHARFTATSLLLSLMLALIAAITGVAGVSQPAHAAGAWGAGGFGWSSNGTWLGNFIAADGTRVYCVDLHISGLGSGGDAGSLSSTITARGGDSGGGTRALSGAELRMINYAITVHGQTADNVTGAAVAAYVWNFTSTNHYGNGAQYIGGPMAAEIHARYQQIKADTEARAHLGGGEGSGSFAFSIDPSNHYLGTMTVTTSPTNASGTVTLTNGVFADSGSPTRTGVRHGDIYPVLGVAPEDGSDYWISAAGAFTGQGTPTYGADVRLHSDAPQRTAGPGTSSPGVVNFDVQGQDTTSRSSTFQPVVGTRVASVFVAESEPLVDVLTFSTAPDDAEVNNYWFQNLEGAYAPITAEATIYGPFLAQPLESDTVPVNAPIAAEGISVTTSREDGPTIEYTVDSGFSPTESGFYTWVWSITAAQQQQADPNVQAYLPENYQFADRFGQVTETSISPSQLAITTQLPQTEIGVGQLLSDDVTVAVYGGGWLQQDAARAPATLTGTAYYSTTEPQLSEHAPPDAEVIGTLELTFDDATTLTSAPLRMPFAEGFVTFQWCLNESAQPEALRGLFAETCDLYGQASETVRLVAPTVTTLALQHATTDDAIFDTAIIDGPVPEHTVLTFSLYEMLDELAAPSCTPENLIAVTEALPVHAGDHSLTNVRSPEVHVEREGTYWWIESLTFIDPDTSEESLIHTGECGLVNETTTVSNEPPPAEPPATPLPPAEPELSATGSSNDAAEHLLASGAALIGIALCIVLTRLAVVRRNSGSFDRQR